MLKRIIIVSLIFICTIAIYGDKKKTSINIAYRKKVIGTFQLMAKITDGIKTPSNYAETVKRKGVENFFVVVLGQAKYINKVKLYWVKGYQPSRYKVEIGKNIFEWEKKIIHILKNETEKGGLIITTDDAGNTAGFFVKVTILEPMKYPVRISEIELFTTKKKIEVKIKDFKVTDIKEHSAVVKFETTYPTTAYVRIGESPHGLKDYGHELDIYRKHNIPITGLLKGTVYYIQPVAVNIDGRVIMGKVYRFKTKGIPLPRVIKFEPSKINKFNVKLTLKINVPCKIEVYLGESIKSIKKIYSNKQLKDFYKLKVDGLIPETEFACKVVLIDKFGNKTDKIIKFKTKEDNIAYKKKCYGTFWGAGSMPDFKMLMKATDENLDKNGLAISGIVKKQEQYLIVDLNKEVNLRNIEVIWRAVDYPEKFDVYLGSSLKKMKLLKKDIKTVDDGEKIASKGDYGLILRKVYIACQNRVARYIKVVVPKGTKILSDLPFDPKPYVQLAEIKAFKMPDYGEPEYKVSIIN